MPASREHAGRRHEGLPHRRVVGHRRGAGARTTRRGGATLGLFARREAELARLAAALAPATVATYAGDVRDADALARAATDFIARFGVPDVVIANAGVSRGTLTTHREDLPAFRAVFDTNVIGMVATFQPFVAPMRDARARRAGRHRQRRRLSRAAGRRRVFGSKAAAITYLESLRIELRGSGVAVVTICPGLHRHAADRRQSVPDAVPDCARRRGAQDGRARSSGDARFYVLPWQMALAGPRC